MQHFASMFMVVGLNYSASRYIFLLCFHVHSTLTYRVARTSFNND